jgi:hypothetical protein
LVDVVEIEKKIENSVTINNTNNTANIVFSGSTQELLKMFSGGN